MTMQQEQAGSQTGAEGSNNELVDKAKVRGSLRVIVRLNLDSWKPQGELPSRQAVDAQREAIAHLQTRLLERIAYFSITDVKRFKFVPQVAMEVDAAGLQDLLSNPDVLGVSQDAAMPPTF
jgi:hypothetical protein